MGVVISKPAINLREQLTELKAQQGYEQKQFHFDNLVTNGTFDTDTDWTFVSFGWTINTATGRAEHSGASFGNLTPSVNVGLKAGRKYEASINVLAKDGGTIYFYWDNTAQFQSINTAGVTTIQFVPAVDNSNIAIGTGVDNVEIDNISVYEIDPADNKVIHTMPKGWKPLHVFEDGALQREGSAYDYTVEYDGFNYIVKETVAPVAPYSTTVIGVRA
jgi:hypothetical protein